MLVWESALTDEPGDQNADSNLGDHAYWSLSPNSGQRWSVELITRTDELTETSDGFHLGEFASERKAKHAAQTREDAAHRCH
jgi:hypothetical protein